MITTEELFDLIEEYVFAFKSKEDMIKHIFNGNISSFTNKSKEEIEDVVNRNLSSYFKKLFENKKLPLIIKKYIKTKKVLLKKDMRFLDNIIIDSEYELTFDDIEKIIEIKQIKEYVNNNDDNNIELVKQLKEFLEVDDTNLEETEKKEDTSYVGDIYNLYNKDIREYKVLTREEERSLLERYLKENDQEAFDILILSNQGLCKKIAEKYKNRGLSKLDLIQEGNLGLMRAIKSFDLKRETKLSTYAVWWIEQSIKKALKDKAKAIHIPLHLQDIQEKIGVAEVSFLRKEGREPSIDELVKLTGLTKSKIENAKKYDIRMVSFDKKVNQDEDDGSSLGDFLKSDMETPEELIEKKVDKEILETLLSRLAKDPNISDGKRSEQIIRLRFGIGLYNEETYKLIEKAGLEIKDKYILEDIGKIFGITRERIRQLEAKAIQALNRYGRSIKRELENEKYEEPVIVKQKKPRKKYTYKNKDNKTE